MQIINNTHASSPPPRHPDQMKWVFWLLGGREKKGNDTTESYQHYDHPVKRSPSTGLEFSLNFSYTVCILDHTNDPIEKVLLRIHKVASDHPIGAADDQCEFQVPTYRVRGNQKQKFFSSARGRYCVTRTTLYCRKILDSLPEIT